MTILDNMQHYDAVDCSPCQYLGKIRRDSFLLKETVVCSQCVFKDIYRVSCVVLHVIHEGCGLQGLCEPEAGKNCISSLLDFRMTTECVASS